MERDTDAPRHATPAILEPLIKRKIRQDLQGEAGLSPMPLTGIGAAERPHTEVRAGCIEASMATPGRACLPSLA